VQPGEQESFIQSLEDQGEDWTLRALARGVFPTWQARSAAAWLDDKEAAKQTRFNRETLRIAKSANRAAWIAAIMAIIAVIMAGVTIAISLRPS
jgi:hypothetical protein